MPLPYTEKVMEHFKNPRNVGRIEDADAKAQEGSPACGDMVSVYLKVDKETQSIKDIKFESYGCASNIATGSIITELAKGKTLEEAKSISWKQASDALGGLPPVKTHCSVLAVDGLRAAIENYEERHGLIKERTPTTVEVVRKRLGRRSGRFSYCLNDRPVKIRLKPRTGFMPRAPTSRQVRLEPLSVLSRTRLESR